MSILCIGQCAYDITFPIHEPLCENQKYRIYDKFECIGAPAANAAVLCVMWEEESILISRIGKDFYGKQILRVLETYGVEATYVIEDKEFSTPVSAIIANSMNGSRTIFNCPGHQRELNFRYPDRADVILVDGHELQASIEALQKYPNAVSVIDAGTYKEETRTLGALVDHLVCSQDFARQYMGIQLDDQNQEVWLKAFSLLHEINEKNIVVTLGESGLLYEKEGEICHLPAYRVKAVDTTGAGDIFHGAYAYCIQKGYSLEDTLKISSAASAISVQTLGGQPSIPDKERVNEFLKAHGEGIRVK